MSDLILLFGFIILLITTIVFSLKHNKLNKKLNKEDNMPIDEVIKLSNELKELNIKISRNTKILKHYSGISKEK